MALQRAITSVGISGPIYHSPILPPRLWGGERGSGLFFREVPSSEKAAIQECLLSRSWGRDNCWLIGCFGAVRLSAASINLHPGPFSGADSLLPLPRLAGLCPHLPAPSPCLSGTGIWSVSWLSFSLFRFFPPSVFPPHFSNSIQATSLLHSVFSHSFILDMIVFSFSRFAALEVNHQGQTHVGFKRTGNAFDMISPKENFNAFEIGEHWYLSVNQAQTVKLGPQTVHKINRMNSCCGSIFSAYTACAGVFKETEE